MIKLQLVCYCGPKKRSSEGEPGPSNIKRRYVFILFYSIYRVVDLFL